MWVSVSGVIKFFFFCEWDKDRVAGGLRPVNLLSMMGHSTDVELVDTPKNI